MGKLFGMGFVLIVATLALGCSNKLAGELDVDGSRFELESCRSGQVYGFAGVELRAKDGRKLRLVQTPTGEAGVVLFGDGKTTGEEVALCGPFTVKQQNSTINDIKNVEGEASLDCTGGGHTIKGSVAFANCH